MNLFLPKVYLRTSRIRHGGKNETGSKGWADKEAAHFECAMCVLLTDIKSLMRTETVSVDKIVDVFEKIWCFVEFNKEDRDEDTEARRKWFLDVVWSKG